MKKNKGFTLIEVIVAMALMSLIIMGSFSMLNFGNVVYNKSLVEYDLQAKTRQVSTQVNHISRYSTAVFTIPNSSFRENNLTDGWDYIGILDGAIVTFKSELDGAGNPVHTKTVMVPADPDIDYKIVFQEVDEDEENKILKFSIQGFAASGEIQLDDDGNPIPYIDLTSQVESLNSLQIIHKGTELNPSVALAFKTEDRSAPVIQQILPVAQVAMVLDVSGSMNWKMNGDTTNTTSLRRITLMKEAANELITSFNGSDNPVSISLVPFSTMANNPKAFRSAQSEAALLQADITALVANGGTNTGDGLRRAYHQIINGRTNPDYNGKVVSDYIIVLVDGVTTFGTRTSTTNSNSPFRTTDGNVASEAYIYGNGSTLDNTHGTPYVNTIGNTIKGSNIKVFVIGFSSRTSDLASVDDIVTATGAEPKFIAGDIDELKLAFGEIQQQILSELWYISGPIM